MYVQTLTQSETATVTHAYFFLQCKWSALEGKAVVLNWGGRSGCLTQGACFFET